MPLAARGPEHPDRRSRRPPDLRLIPPRTPRADARPEPRARGAARAAAGLRRSSRPPPAVPVVPTRWRVLPMLGFLDAGVSVAYHLVTTLASAFAPVAGSLAAAAAIVAFTLAVRLLLLPLSYYGLRGQAAQARLQPQIAELRRRYASQPDRLQRELAAFYQREGGGLLLGCLPLLVQLPVLQRGVPAVPVPLRRRSAQPAAGPPPARRAARLELAERRPAHRARPGLPRPVRAARPGRLAVRPAGQPGHRRRPVRRRPARRPRGQAPRPAPRPPRTGP